MLMDFQQIPRFTSAPGYRVAVDLPALEDNLRRYEESYGLQLSPDFQRAHVWREFQQVQFVEYFLRGGRSGLEIYFNCPGWQDDFQGPMVLVDGKQRIQALCRFLRNEIPAFGTFFAGFTGRVPRDRVLYFNIHNLSTRKEVLQWYVDMNRGGTPHTDEEIRKVEELIVAER